MNLEEWHFQAFRMRNSGSLEELLPWSGRYLDEARFAFPGRQNTEKLLTGSHVLFSLGSHNP
jgi:hypothetical protein